MAGKLEWIYFPKSSLIPPNLKTVVNVFENNHQAIDSTTHEVLHSNDVLELVGKDLINLGFKIEVGKAVSDVIGVPVLFGLNGKIEKQYKADGFEPNEGIVLEIEAGRAVTNNQFLKDLFEACVMHNTNYLVLAVRKIYRKNPDFKHVLDTLETLYVSGRLTLPLKGILLIGY